MNLHTKLISFRHSQRHIKTHSLSQLVTYWYLVRTPWHHFLKLWIPLECLFAKCKTFFYASIKPLEHLVKLQWQFGLGRKDSLLGEDIVDFHWDVNRCLLAERTFGLSHSLYLIRWSRCSECSVLTWINVLCVFVVSLLCRLKPNWKPFLWLFTYLPYSLCVINRLHFPFCCCIVSHCLLLVMGCYSLYCFIVSTNMVFVL